MLVNTGGWGANIDISLTKSGTVNTYPNGVLSYTLRVTNNTSNKDATNIKIVDTLPTGVTYTSGSGTNWTCSAVAQSVTCNLSGTLLRSSTAPVLTINAVAPSTIGSIINSATVSQSADDNDPTTANNTATATTAIDYTANNWRLFSAVNYSGDHNMKGDITVAGNSVMVASGGGCLATTTRNNAASVTFADIDSNASTFNSTSAELKLPITATDKEIVWAGLYWQGYLVDQGDANKSNAKNILFKTPTSSNYIALTSDTSKYNWLYVTGSSYNRFYYQGVTDVTSLVKAAGEGNYTVANLYSSTLDGFTTAQLNTVGGAYGAWGLVVVYKDSNTTFKNIAVYDGYLSIGTVGASASGPVFSDYDIDLSGFLTPSTNPINSKFLVFAGEGDAGSGTGDRTKLSSGASLTNLIGLYNAKNPIDNIYNASISNEGVSVTNRDPNCENTIGSDIDIFNVGSTAPVGTQGQVIQINQTQARIRLNSTGDGYFPGVFAFSTDLYQPNMCYVEEIFKGDQNISGVGAQVNEDDILKVRVTVKNNGTDIAKGVQVLHPFDNAKFPYITNSTFYENLPTRTRIHGTDGQDSDLFEHNATAYLSKINLGNGASSTGGGEFVTIASDSDAYSVYEYNATVKNVDSNFSNTYKAAYVSDFGLDYSNNPVTMEPCTGSKNSFWGYRALQIVVGDFNVVYADHANGALTSGYYYNLPTQITSRADNYKVISLDSNTLKDINTTVAVELVDADSSADCSTMTRISGLKTWIPFDNESNVNFFAQNIIDGMILYDTDAATKFYQHAGKNVKFRISYPKDESNGTIIMNETVPGKYHLNNFPSYAGDTCVSPVTATTYNPANGNPQGTHTYSQVPEACGNAGQSGASAMTQHEVNVCLECIYGTKVTYICSQDNFAIRPEAFFVKLNDQNQTNSATKQFMMNNTPSPANQNMAGGYRYYTEVNATNHLGDASSLDYNTSENIDFVWNSTQTGCNDDTNKSIAFNFVNGLADGNVSVDQVGEYRLRIVDTVWTAVDSNISLMPLHTSPYFMVGTPDCETNSSVSSVVKTTGIGSSAVLNGCNIDTNHTNTIPNPDITYTDSDVTFHPYKFDMTTINFGVGTLPQDINATSGPDFVYMSDMSRTDSMNMSVRATGTISARGENNSTLSNFVDNCYAVNTNLSMNTYNNITLANTDYQVRFVDSNGSGTLYDSNATNLVTSALTISLMTLNDGNFTKDMSGSLNTVTRLNYDRNQTTPLNPMAVQYGALGFKCVTTSECTMQADLSGSYEANGSRAMDFNVTHVYGRIIPRDVRVFGNVNFVANAWYEGYNAPTLNGASLEASKIDALWYVNNVHTDANDGDANVTVVIPTSPLTLPTHSSSTTGMESYQFSAIPLANIPYGGKAHINTDPWLWYGINALNYADPVNSTNLDCLTHPCFNITIVPSIGATGSAKSTNEGTKASKKSDSGGGTWKSTSDYAPAIR
nr:hypothetical protein [Sulfuricurvum sp. RIFCSPLOWO2_12_FULL_43_24]